MTATRAVRIAGAALIALASVNANAQPGASEAGAASHTATTGMTAKDTRAANRALRRRIYAAIVKHKEITSCVAMSSVCSLPQNETARAVGGSGPTLEVREGPVARFYVGE